MAELRYPPDLADAVLAEWPAAIALAWSREELHEVLSVCFLASLTTEEGRPVRFRLLLTDPSTLPDDGEPNVSALRLSFAETRPFDADELRRLSPAVPFETGLVGVCRDNGRLRIWGIVHSGAAWLAPTWGGRSAGINWTLAPIVHVSAPGRVAVRVASRLVAGLERGLIVTSSMDVFEAEWLKRLFAGAGADDSLARIVGQHMLRRVLRLISTSGHGAMLLFVDPDVQASAIRPKYTFADEAPRRRYQALLEKLTTSLVASSHKDAVSWEDFRDGEEAALAGIEAQIFELSRLIASLSATDGAVLLDKRLELLAFGVEVSAELPSNVSVWRALDIEGKRRTCDLTESVGTRHRAAYRFVQSHPRGLAVVISHDGAVRFVAWHDGVTYWEHASGP